MKLKKKIGILTAIVGITMVNTTYAQQPNSKDTTRLNIKELSVTADDPKLVKEIGMWVRSPFPDNWYVSFQAGGQLYMGYEDYKGPLFSSQGGRISSDFNLMLGRWVSPQIGYRAALGLGNANGFITRKTYEDNFSSIFSHAEGGHSDPYMCGYYHYFNDELYIQRWNYGSIMADLMFNLISASTYDPTSRYLFTLYGGVGCYLGMSEKIAVGVTGVEETPNIGFDMHLGAIVNRRLNKQWSIYGDLRGTIIDNDFDREWLGGVESIIFNRDFFVTAHIGITYHFNWRSEEKRTQWYSETDNGYNLTANDGTSQPIHISKTINIHETVTENKSVTVDTLESFSPEYDELLDDRARDLAARERARLNSLYNNRRPELSQNATLDDILSQKLLPYEMVFFEINQSTVSTSEEIKLAKMAEIIKSYPNEHFLLIGASDSKTGTPQRNMVLSTDRCDACYHILVNKFGVNPAQLTRIYLGSIADFEPYELNRSTTIIMDHPKVIIEFNKLKIRK
ncbi:MAG: OmpA family protein [Bacteroidales bacterium]|nr:OmpA family protein [Bacteroidales bacterium]